MERMSSVRFDENDDVKDMLDAILTSPGLGREYEKKPQCCWIGMIGDQNMEEGIRELPEPEQEILEKFFLKGKNLIDISIELGMPMDMVLGHIKAISIRLKLYV